LLTFALLFLIFTITFASYYTTLLAFISQYFPLVKTNTTYFSLITLFIVLVISLFNTSIILSIGSSLFSLYNLTLTSSTFSLPDLIYSFESQISAFNLVSTYLDNIEYPYSTEFSFAFTTKLAGCLSFLILIRGGVPRYRYDILTKLGWVKFLGFVLAIFILTLVMFFLW